MEVKGGPVLYRKQSTLRARYAPVELEFADLVYVVTKRGTRNDKLQILKGVSGSCRSGRVLAIMGPSGCGKSTLLDVLSGFNLKGGAVKGEIFVNGDPLCRSEFRRTSCYVQQRDVLLASSTVRETLALSAMLKLPSNMPYPSKMRRVNAVLEELDLDGCADTLIGDESQMIKGISGGQKRRVSVGMELVKDPRVMFMDEPTSGLDSENAVAMMDLLVSLARNKGRTIALSIHMPNSIITTNFDDFLLLYAGSVVYRGPWSHAVVFFGNCGFPCPLYQNPTDFFMSVLKDSASAESLLASFKQQKVGLQGISDVEEGREEGDGKRGGGSSPAGAVGKPLEVSVSPSGEPPPTACQSYLSGGFTAPAPTASFWTQVWLLTGRMYLEWCRNPNMLLAEGSQYAFMAIFIGLVYLQLGDSVDTGVHDRVFSLFLPLAVLGFTPAFTIYCVVSYFMIGYVIGASEFFTYLGAFILYQITSESLGELCAMITSNASFAILILTFIMLFVMTFSGVLVSDIPVYFRWCQRISYLTYALAACLKSQFFATTFHTAQGIPVPGRLLLPDTVNDELSIGGNLLVLLGLTVAVRFFAYLGLEFGIRLNFL